MADPQFYIDGDFAQVALDLLLEFGFDAQIVRPQFGAAADRRDVGAEGTPLTMDVKFMPSDYLAELSGKPPVSEPATDVFYIAGKDINGDPLPFDPDSRKNDKLVPAHGDEWKIVKPDKYLEGMEFPFLWGLKCVRIARPI